MFARAVKFRESMGTAEQTLTRNEFYKLAHECRDYAQRLATHDQSIVSRELCLEFNEFLKRVRTYDLLETPLAELDTARPITRQMVLGGAALLWLAFALIANRLLGQISLLELASASMLGFLILFLIPPGVYGTSVEAIEGKVLVVTHALQKLLEEGDLEFSEAAYFVVRDVLRETSSELRQQVYLNRSVGWRRQP